MSSSGELSSTNLHCHESSLAHDSVWLQSKIYVNMERYQSNHVYDQLGALSYSISYTGIGE